MGISFELQDELQAFQGIAHYDIPKEQDTNNNDPGPLLQHLEAVRAIAHSSEEITDPEIFDIFRSLLKHSDAVAGAYMSKMLDALLSAFGAQIDAAIRDSKEKDQQIVMAHKLPLEMYAFLVNWFVSAVEKVKAMGEENAPPAPVKARRGWGGKTGASRAVAKKTAQWMWIDQIPGTLELICKALKLKTHRVWVTRDAFITSSEQYMKIQNIRMHVYKVICLAVKHHGHTLAAQINIMQSLQYYEHLSEPMAECLSILAKEFDHAQLGDEILREIAGKSFSAQDTKGPRAFSLFLVRFSEESPRSVHKQISLLIGHLDSESYPMRMAIVEVIGSLIRELATLFELLSRTLDLSSYVRSKQRLRITRAVVDTLEDKASTARKAAVSILVKLILTHPYGKMYGGDLSLEKWEERYKTWRDKLEEMEGGIGETVERDQGDKEETESNVKEEDTDEDENADDDVDAPLNNPKPKKKKASRKSTVDVTVIVSEQEALAALETNEILAMGLRKKYCTEALDFVRTLEGGVVLLTQLLGSTNKAEVLESMEFFRVAFEHQLAGAKNGIKRMLHLIWHKDNSSTSEDGKELKGVRSRLLECYRMLYFDPLPDMEPKQQVNRIAKNMIELTYEATLAELTSLEEMMRIMMEDGQIHYDVINKLWQVYSAPRALPRSRRRGAISILGMLALSKRTIISEKVDTLLKIGLGPLGKADLTLARYTCLALQRLNGSAKKVKGSLLDKSLRMEMDNPIFRKLQNTIEHPCRSKDWFGMAEQAINTIYALGEHPDELCNNLMEPPEPASYTPSSIHISTQQSSTSEEKDLGDVFYLSQLLFVVGHVAIKHIVFLELVEREWKRQKDEKQLAEKLAAGGSPGRANKETEELDQVAGNAEDEIGERIAAVRETELLYGEQSLLKLYGPLLVHVCGSPHKFKNRTLRAAATLSFSKFLCVSSQFCDRHHHLLFKILETSRDPNIRSNIVIALGDVAVSFSSIIDENSNELYKGLSDGDLVVKKNTLMVLTHLILNGMIKVKGQLGEMVKCLEDEEPRISDLAKLFFKELSTKDNAIYNNLPDVISHLSIGDHSVEEDIFESTMRYIFSFIEKKAENIVEKLCQRFRLSEDPRQWRDIAFCLSFLPFKSERSVKKLIEGLQFYRDKLHEEGVFDRFSEILSKARSNKSANKPDTELNEFESILDECRRQGEEDQAIEKRVEGKKAAAKRKATRRSARKKAVEAEPEPHVSPTTRDDDDMYV
ncbi:hypothetical protein BDR04DRAFT_1134704, partial [Suillus decipiens]